jgi:4-hydroxy-2-oxoheptanedioate aldolase
MMPMSGGELASTLRARLREGGVVLSTFVKLSDTEVVDVLGQCGLDAMVIDMEHSQLDDADARRLVRYAASIGFPAMVRLPAVDPGVINRLLEAGAAGIQLSSVTCRRHVDELLAACRFPPDGSRSASLAQPDAAYGTVPLPDYLGREGPFLVGQIESGATEDCRWPCGHPGVSTTPEWWSGWPRSPGPRGARGGRCSVDGSPTWRRPGPSPTVAPAT